MNVLILGNKLSMPVAWLHLILQNTWLLEQTHRLYNQNLPIVLLETLLQLYQLDYYLNVTNHERPLHDLRKSNYGVIQNTKQLYLNCAPSMKSMLISVFTSRFTRKTTCQYIQQHVNNQQQSRQAGSHSDGSYVNFIPDVNHLQWVSDTKHWLNIYPNGWKTYQYKQIIDTIDSISTGSQ